MSGLTPTAAAMRVAQKLETGHDDGPSEMLMADWIDRMTGLPELIAALEAYVANDDRTPMQAQALAALAIADRGRK